MRLALCLSIILHIHWAAHIWKAGSRECESFKFNAIYNLITVVSLSVLLQLTALRWCAAFFCSGQFWLAQPNPGANPAWFFESNEAFEKSSCPDLKKKINYNNNNKKEIQTYFAAPAGCLYLPTWQNTSVWLNETVYIWCANQNHGLQIAHYYKTAEWVTDWREKCGRETCDSYRGVKHFQK